MIWVELDESRAEPNDRVAEERNGVEEGGAVMTSAEILQGGRRKNGIVKGSWNWMRCYGGRRSKPNNRWVYFASSCTGHAATG